MHVSNAHPPYLDLRDIRPALRVIQAVRFAVQAARFIRESGFGTFRTITYADSRDRVFGISATPMLFPATQKTIERIGPLIVRLEDRRFWAHRGVDPLALVRAFIRNMRSLRIREGGSTLTQQLVRNVFIYPHRSILRKGLEILLALCVERNLTKEEILLAYCNLVYLGPGVRGFEAALRLYHRKTSATATVAEIHSVLGCLRRPMRSSPLVNLAAYRARADQVSTFLGAPDTRQVLSTPVQLGSRRKPRLDNIVSEELARERAWQLRRTDIRRANLTIQSEVQNALICSLRQAARDPSVDSVAGVVMCVKSGEIVAEGGLKDGADASFSTAFFGRLQPASTFKPFVLLEALEQGVALESCWDSSPFSWYSREFESGVWKIRNFNHRYFGDVSLAHALVVSDNTVFARLTHRIGVGNALKRLRAFELISERDVNASCVLGAVTDGISLVRLARAYAALATSGKLPVPHIVRSVDVGSALPISRATPVPLNIAVSAAALSKLDSALQLSGIRRGRREIRGKSGSAGRGNLYAGYDNDFSYAVWVGFRGIRPEWWNKGIKAKSILERVLDGISRRTLSI